MINRECRWLTAWWNAGGSVSLHWGYFQVQDQEKRSRSISALLFATTLSGKPYLTWRLSLSHKFFSVPEPGKEKPPCSPKLFFFFSHRTSSILSHSTSAYIVAGNTGSGGVGHQILFHSGSTVPSRAGCIMNII